MARRGKKETGGEGHPGGFEEGGVSQSQIVKKKGEGGETRENFVAKQLSTKVDGGKKFPGRSAWRVKKRLPSRCQGEGEKKSGG